jgi:acyl-coenzyme A synthetase/AMP-(fatty) acid ligase
MTCVRLERYIPEDFLDAIQKYRVQAVPVVPPVALMLAKSPLVDKYDLSSLKRVMVSAAPTKLEVVQMLRRRLHVKVRDLLALHNTMTAYCLLERTGAPDIRLYRSIANISCVARIS